MSTDIERYQPPARESTFGIMGQAIELASQVAMTEFVPTSLRGRPEAVVAAILQGHELGLEPMTSLAKVHIIEGRPTLAAELMRALVQRAGHEIWLESSSSTSVTMGGRRRGEEHPTRVTWTMDDAKRAELSGKKVWKRYPRAMLVARATGELCRILFADVMAGISYTAEEVRDGIGELDDDEEILAAEGEATIDSIDEKPDDVEDAPPPTTTRTATDPGAGQATTTTRTRSASDKPKGRRAAPPAPEPPEPELDEPPVAPVAPGSDTAGPVSAGDHQAGDTVAGPTGSSYTPAQALAIRAREVGLSEDERHGLISAYTGGRTKSGKDLNFAEVRSLFEYLDQIASGELQRPELDGEVWLVRWPDGTTEMASDEAEQPASGDDPGDAETPSTDSGAEVAEPVESAQEGTESTESGQSEPDTPADVAPEDVPGSEDDWRAFLRSHGLKVADVLRSAAALAGDPKVAPASLAVLSTNPELSAKVVAWAKGESS